MIEVDCRKHGIEEVPRNVELTTCVQVLRILARLHYSLTCPSITVYYYHVGRG